MPESEIIEKILEEIGIQITKEEFEKLLHSLLNSEELYKFLKSGDSKSIKDFGTEIKKDLNSSLLAEINNKVQPMENKFIELTNSLEEETKSFNNSLSQFKAEIDWFKNILKLVADKESLNELKSAIGGNDGLGGLRGHIFELNKTIVSLVQNVNDLSNTLGDATEGTGLASQIVNVQERLSDKLGNVEKKSSDKLGNVEKELSDKLSNVEKELSDKTTSKNFISNISIAIGLSIFGAFVSSSWIMGVITDPLKTQLKDIKNNTVSKETFDREISNVNDKLDAITEKLNSNRGKTEISVK